MRIQDWFHCTKSKDRQIHRR